MKNSIKSLIRVIAMVAIIFAVNLSYAQTTSVSFNCSTSGLVPGAIIEVPVVFTSTANVGTWSVVFYYNRDVLTYSSCTFDGAWTGFAPGVNANYALPTNSPQHPSDTATKVSWGSVGGLSSACNPRTAFILYFKYNGGTTNLEVINKSTLTTQTQNHFSYLKNPTSVNVNTSWSGLSSLSGSLAPIASVANGGNWSVGASWDLGHKPNTSNGTISINSNPATPLVVDANISTTQNLVINTGKALTVNAGKTLAVAGSFTIKDGGSYINNGSGPTSGTVERTIAKDNSWHFIASPVDGAAIKPNFAPTAVDATFDFYRWNQAESNNYPGVPWENIRNNSGAYASGFDNFEIGRGYLVAYSPSYSLSATHNFVGTLGNGDKTVAVGYNTANHYCLLGNPYPSAINWDNATLQSNALASLGSLPEIRIWNSNAGQYGVYSNGAGVNDASNIIAPNQAFFVKAIAANNFIIPNAARVHGTQAFLKSTSSDLLKLKVSSTANAYTDEMVVRFDANATNDGVTKWNSLIATAPSLYSVKNNENYTINTLTAVNSNLVVPVGFKAGVNGMYSITASELNSFSTPTYVYLKDLANNNTITDLNSTAMYSFAATTTDNADRFQLIFALSPLSISNNVKENTNIYSYDNTIYINSNESIKQIDVYNTLGQLIKTFENKSGSVVVNMNGNSEGYYIVKVITNTNVYSQKVLVK
ncbi:MAG: T9SS type A sorting domain-containing protein [Bacteroidales bacterium]